MACECLHGGGTCDGRRLLYLAEEDEEVLEQVGVPHNFKLENWCVLLSKANQQVRKGILSLGGL